jgi:hypothetical protein
MRQCRSPSPPGSLGRYNPRRASHATRLIRKTPPLCSCSIKVAASPRNHLYRTSELIVNSPGNGAVFVRVLAQTDHLGNVADELDFKAGLDGRPEDHLIHQGADDFDCFGAGGAKLVVQINVVTVFQREAIVVLPFFYVDDLKFKAFQVFPCGYSYVAA